jgi:hypothetical protein
MFEMIQKMRNNGIKRTVTSVVSASSARPLGNRVSSEQGIRKLNTPRKHSDPVEHPEYYNAGLAESRYGEEEIHVVYMSGT